MVRTLQPDPGLMTVCVAAICEGDKVLGVSDRMITAGDIEFEPPRPKIIPLTTSIVAMTSGDNSLQTEILANVTEAIRARMTVEPGRWWRVDEVAALHSRFYNEAKLNRAESSVLMPLGLDRASFLSRQRELAPDLVQWIAKELTTHPMPPINTIFAGIDPTGPHIHVMRGANLSCQDSTGFGAIGIGDWHAESYLMFQAYSPSCPATDCIMSVYTAKKRAEVAPGVGVQTDMFIMGPELGSYVTVHAGIVERLERMYHDVRLRTAAVAEETRAQTREVILELIQDARDAASASNQQAPRMTEIDRMVTARKSSDGRSGNGPRKPKSR